MTGGGSGANKPVQVIRGRNSAKVFLLVFLAFVVASNLELYQVSLFSLDTSMRDIDEVVASLAVTFVVIFWTARAFVARVELYDDRVVYQGIQRHRVLPIASVDRFSKGKTDPHTSVLLGNEKQYLILGAFEFHGSDIDRILDFVKEKVREQGQTLITETHGMTWLWKKQHLQWPPEYPFIICMAAIVWLLFFS